MGESVLRLAVMGKSEQLTVMGKPELLCVEAVMGFGKSERLCPLAVMGMEGVGDLPTCVGTAHRYG